MIIIYIKCFPNHLIIIALPYTPIKLLLHLRMNTLKKALTKDDTRKYNKSKIEISSIKPSHKYKDIESIMMKVNESRCRKVRKKRLINWKISSKK